MSKVWLVSLIFPTLVIMLVSLGSSKGSEEIEQVFVARRPLHPGTKNWHKYRYLAHSALLLRTVDQKYHILEYMGDSKSHLYEIKLKVIKTIHNPPHEIFKLDGIEWTKQLYGKSLSGWTLSKVSIF